MNNKIPVFISFSNYGYIKLAENLVLNIQKKVKNHRFVMYCLDEETYQHLLTYQKPGTIDLILYNQFNVSKQFQNYNTVEFKEIDHLHISIIFDALEKYQFIHFLDSDTVVVNEPLPEYYESYQEYDVVFQCDSDLLEPDYNIWSCIGNMSIRNTQGTHFLLDAINIYKKNYFSKGINLNDQEIMKEVFKGSNTEDIRYYPHAKLTQYPSIHYTCGVLVDKEKVDISKIHIFHANWVIGINNKIMLLKKVGEWYLE
jgi:hypothetical protein